MAKCHAISSRSDRTVPGRLDGCSVRVTRTATTISALDELLADGQLGAAGARALYRTVLGVAGRHGYPPPEGHRRWDDDAAAEIAHDFLADARTPKRLTHLAVHALDEVGFDRLLYKMVLNYFRDRGRKTEIGRLMLRLRDVLDGHDEFVAEPGDRWRLATTPAEPSGAAPSELVAAAAAEPDVTVPRWSHQNRRNAPVADAPSIVRLCRRVLTAAAGSLPLDGLARAIAPRLGVGPTPIAHNLDTRDVFETVAAPQYADASVDGMRAGEIFGALGERERLLLAHPDKTVRELREVIGLGPTQAAEVKTRLYAYLRLELQDDDDFEAVLFHLVDQARAWAAGQRGEMERQVSTT